jgi:para-nitrobenzyl esterase
MPASRGLFHRAIIESGPCQAAGFITADKGRAQGDDFAKALGCTDAATALTCMRAKTAAEVGAALPARKVLFGADGVTWGPVVDGDELPKAPLDAFADGGAAPGVPVIVGTNRDEGNLFTHLWLLAFGHDMTEDETKASLAVLYTPAQIDTILARYPAASFSTSAARASALLTDDLFVCATRRVARALAAHGTPTWLYQFKYAFNAPLLPGLGAAHSFELPFVFGTTLGGKNIGDDEKPLSDAMIGYWTRFGAAGDPNGAGAPSWPRYDAATDTNLVLDAAITTEAALKKDACDFWDTLP